MQEGSEEEGMEKYSGDMSVNKGVWGKGVGGHPRIKVNGYMRK